MKTSLTVLGIVIAMNGLAVYCLRDDEETANATVEQTILSAHAPETFDSTSFPNQPPNATSTPPSPQSLKESPENPAPDFSKITAFNNWTQHWLTASALERDALKPEGAALAEARRAEFKALIMRDPQRALEQAVPRVILQDLPEEITALLEKPISATGNYNVYFGRPPPGHPMPAEGLSLRYFEVPGKSYKAHVFGSMETAMSKKDIPLRGVAIDREFAVAESPVRRLETGERILSNATVETLCPVSGKETATVAPDSPITDDTPAVEIGSRVILLCDGSHVTVLDEQSKALIQASGSGGALPFTENYPGTSSLAIGNLRLLYIRITYPDQLRAPNTEDIASRDMSNVARFYLESSYGKLTATTVFTPLIVLPHPVAWYNAKDTEVDGLGLIQTDARTEARKLGYDSRQFQCIIVRASAGLRGGASWGGGDSAWIGWDGMDVLDHECGHSLGRNHANFWKTTDNTAYGQGGNEEYGNPYDVMGGGFGFSAQYNSISKRALGWLPDSYIHKPLTNGIYRLFAYDQPQLEDGRRYALRVVKDSARTYCLEYHPAFHGLGDSALVLYSWPGIGNAGNLLDVTPGTPSSRIDSGIAIGRTYSDPEVDMHFTVVSKNDTSPPSLDLAYNHGPFPGNLPPVATLSASVTSIAVGGSVTFTAMASDPNGDPLSYNWGFNDAVTVTNTPVFTRVFPTAGLMTVMLTVSDMKGGVTRQHVQVNVGTHQQQSVTGQILESGQPLAGVLVSDGTKYCYSDSQGNYILAGLAVSSRTLTAKIPGHVLTANAANPFSVVAGSNVVSWSGVSATFLSLTKTADAMEGGANGVFTLTRTGDISADLIVRVATVGGTAARTTDYTFSPDYVNDSEFRKFTIPAGSASLPITVAAVDDASKEGPETITLSLVSNGNYIASGENYVTMTLEDNDSTLPQVSVMATDPYAAEFPAEPGVFTFKRTGPTTNALSVSVIYSGAATNGADYMLLPAIVTIPSGQSSASVNIAPLNDSNLETPEDCVVTIASAATYTNDISAQTATIVINDDDAAVVSVTALDPDASEAGRDPGMFLITRTGATANPLKVYFGLAGTALHGTDYIALPGEIIIPSGAASVPVIITPYDDDFGEAATESVILNLTTFNSTYSLASSYSATVNIADNGDLPVISVSAGTSPAEPSTKGSIVFHSTGSIAGNVNVYYTVSGTATPGTDYTPLSGTVSVPTNGSNDVGVAIPVLNDSLLEGMETVIVTLTPNAAYRILNEGTATARLKDNAPGDKVMVSTWNKSPVEGGSTARFYIGREAIAGDLSVNYIMSGTAINGTDYVLLPGTVVIPDGQKGVDVTITPIEDTLIEGTETIIMTLVPAATYGLDVPSTASFYMADNDTAPILAGFQTSASTTSEALGATGEYRDIPVTLSAASTETITMEYVSGGGSALGDDVDWGFANAAAGNAAISKGVLSFAPGTTTQTIRIRVRNDAVVEGSETALLTLQNARFARISSTLGTHTLTITDADNPMRRVRFLVSASTRSEPEATEPMLMAVLDRAADSTPTTISYTVSGTATQGSDFILPPGTLTFAPGETFKMLPLTILTDAVSEVPETVIVTLTNPVNAVLGAITTHTLTIRESTVPAVTIAAAQPEVAENAGSAKFTFTRSGTGNANPLTIFYLLGGTAIGGHEYVIPAGSLTIPANANSAELTISLMDDLVEEADETLVITLAANAAYAVGAMSQASLTILDDDQPPVVVIAEPSMPAVAIPVGVGLMLRSEASHTTPLGTSNLTTTWSKVSGPGTVTFEDAAGRTATTFSAAGDYVLRASASTGGLSGDAEITVRIGIALTQQTIGTTTVAGSWNETNSPSEPDRGTQITLTGAGAGISSSGTSDGFYFLAAPMTGDFDVKCQLTGITHPGGGSFRAGIMARASTLANAPYAMSFYRAESTHGFQARLTAATDPYEDISSNQYDVKWMRLVRSGDNFSAFYSGDGITWTQRGTPQAIPAMGASPLLGLAITSAIPTTASTAIFDNLDFHLPTNIGPFVNAGAALAGNAPWNLNATVTDDGRPLPASLATLWQQVTGPGATTFANPSSVDTTATFAVSGDYRLRLTASDGAMTTFADTSAAVTTPSPLEIWRKNNFANNSVTGANLADVDNDGLSNLMEYALGTSPTQRNANPIQFTPGANQCEIHFTRHSDRREVRLTLESSPDLHHWTALGLSDQSGPFTSLVQEVSVSETDEGVVSATFKPDLFSPQSENNHFLRLCVELVGL